VTTLVVLAFQHPLAQNFSRVSGDEEAVTLELSDRSPEPLEGLAVADKAGGPFERLAGLRFYDRCPATLIPTLHRLLNHSV
jgi:hypothetical protein